VARRALTSSRPGELHGAHCLFGMPFAAATKVSELRGDPLRIAMILNNNGQADHALDEGVRPGRSATPISPRSRRRSTTVRKTKGADLRHDLSRRHARPLAPPHARVGRHRSQSTKIKPIPPPQMVANMEAGNMDGYNVGEPWGGVAAKKGVGFTFVATQTLWKHTPRKALGRSGSRFAEERTRRSEEGDGGDPRGVEVARRHGQPRAGGERDRRPAVRLCPVRRDRCTARPGTTTSAVDSARRRSPTT
jgi:hypothetical protein